MSQQFSNTNNMHNCASYSHYSGDNFGIKNQHVYANASNNACDLNTSMSEFAMQFDASDERKFSIVNPGSTSKATAFTDGTDEGENKDFDCKTIKNELILHSRIQSLARSFSAEANGRQASKKQCSQEDAMANASHIHDYKFEVKKEHVSDNVNNNSCDSNKNNLNEFAMQTYTSNERKFSITNPGSTSNATAASGGTDERKNKDFDCKNIKNEITFCSRIQPLARSFSSEASGMQAPKKQCSQEDAMANASHIHGYKFEVKKEHVSANASNSSCDSNQNMSEFAMQAYTSSERKFSITNPGSASKASYGTDEWKNKDFDCKNLKNELTLHSKIPYLDGSLSTKANGRQTIKKQCRQEINPETVAVKEIFHCEQCGQKFQKYKLLSKHSRKHTKDKFKCEVCQKAFWTKSSYNDHCKSHENLTCEECGSQFLQKGAFNAHMIKHIGEKSFACEKCGKKFYQKYNLECHFKSSHIGYKCKECDCQFNRKIDLDTHFKIHTKDKKILCEICGIMFSGDIFDDHYQLHVSKIMFKCEICGQEFSRKDSLKKHNSKHPGGHLLVCAVCQMTFHLKDNILFRKHFMLHIAAGYKSEFGGKTFAYPSSLNRRNRKRIKDKYFKCGQCGRQFSERYKIHKHFRTHIHKKVKCE